MKRTVLIVISVFVLVFSAASAQALDLTGRWKCDDGGTYYLHQVGNVLWWLGESSDNGASWTNVYQGNVAGSNVNGKWADVPQGRIMSSGVMNLRIVDANHLTATQKTGGFGGSNWTRQGGTPSTPPPTAFNLTGVWSCNDGGKYFVRQLGNEVWWLGKSGGVEPGAQWTNVFHGTVTGANVNGSWSDVPHGNIMSGGAMNVQVVNPSLFRAVSKTGGFGGSEWKR